MNDGKTLVEHVIEQTKQFNKDMRLVRLKQLHELNKLLKRVYVIGKRKIKT